MSLVIILLLASSLLCELHSTRVEIVQQFQTFANKPKLFNEFMEDCYDHHKFTCIVRKHLNEHIDHLCNDAYKWLVENPNLLIVFLGYASDSNFYNIDALQHQLYHVIDSYRLNAFKMILNEIQVAPRPVFNRFEFVVSDQYFIERAYQLDRKEMAKLLFLSNPNAYNENYRIKEINGQHSQLLRTILVEKYGFCPIQIISYSNRYVYSMPLYATNHNTVYSHHLVKYFSLLFSMAAVKSDECDQLAVEYLKQSFNEEYWMYLLSNHFIPTVSHIFEIIRIKFENDFFHWNPEQLNRILNSIDKEDVAFHNLNTLAPHRWIAFYLENGFPLSRFNLDMWDDVYDVAIRYRYHRAIKAIDHYKLALPFIQAFSTEDFIIPQLEKLVTPNIKSSVDLLHVLVKETHYEYTALLVNVINSIGIDVVAPIINENSNIKQHLNEMSGECAICMNSLDDIKILKCGHYFHHLCVEKWAKRFDVGEMKCPICRQ